MALKKLRNGNEYHRIGIIKHNRLNDTTSVSLHPYKNKAARDADINDLNRENILEFIYKGQLTIEECYSKIKEPRPATTKDLFYQKDIAIGDELNFWANAEDY